jgi:hypothetical protein
MTATENSRGHLLADIEVTIAAARAGNRDAMRKILSGGPVYDALVQRVRDERAVLITELLKRVPALPKRLFRMRSTQGLARSTTSSAPTNACFGRVIGLMNHRTANGEISCLQENGSPVLRP